MRGEASTSGGPAAGRSLGPGGAGGKPVIATACGGGGRRTRCDEEMQDGGIGLGEELLHKLLILLLHLGSRGGGSAMRVCWKGRSVQVRARVCVCVCWKGRSVQVRVCFVCVCGCKGLAAQARERQAGSSPGGPARPLTSCLHLAISSSRVLWMICSASMFRRCRGTIHLQGVGRPGSGDEAPGSCNPV